MVNGGCIKCRTKKSHSFWGLVARGDNYRIGTVISQFRSESKGGQAALRLQAIDDVRYFLSRLRWRWRQVDRRGDKLMVWQSNI